MKSPRPRFVIAQLGAGLWLCAGLIGSHPALAADALRPGLWETSIKLKLHNMPQIPDEQLQQLEMLGIQLPVGNQPMTVLQCLTPEQARLEKPIVPANDQGCVIRNYRHAGKQVNGDVVCSGSLQGTGKFTMQLQSDTAFKGQLTAQGTSNELGPIDQTTDFSGRWVQAACNADTPTFP
ncbi:DUF3617 domain-containing protein [Methylovorus menthalis]|uniref:DUF3617 domain-containing protein n=1 Tax=Methylovorus menthalis TaxID=1002227 RepID=UPI001E2D560A|nr:DUF3617 domain-containing protein [Methylovorus menthalis]MCB4811979.1 DUF3617 domain-containing protein [Methylovorus menthalis]